MLFLDPHACTFTATLDARPARSKLPSTSSYAGRNRSSCVHVFSKIRRAASAFAPALIVHSPESAMHISAGFSESSTRLSGMLLPFARDACESDDASRSSEASEVEGGQLIMDASVGVVLPSCGVSCDGELGASAQHGCMRRAGLRNVL